MQNKEMTSVLDEELDNCVKKLRNAVYGEEVRTFITEYEELMLKKTHVMTQNFIKDRSENQEGGEKVIWRIPIEAPKSRKNMEAYLMILQIIQGIAVMILTLSVIIRVMQ